MRLHRFDYEEPRSVQEAGSILSNEPTAKILAGGTDLLVNMKDRIETPSMLVNLKRIPGLDAIRQDDSDIRIGALTPLKKIYKTPLINEQAPALAMAAATVGSYHHQVMGTLGGNLCQQNRCKNFNQSKWWRTSSPPCLKVGGEICHVVKQENDCYSSYCGDMAPALLALNSRAVLVTEDTSREIPLAELFSRIGKATLTLQPGEILTEIILPAETLGGFSTYLKFANRESIDFAIVGCALWADLAIKEYRAAFTSVHQNPVRALTAEAFLKGKDLTEEVVEEACQLANKEAKPVKTSLYSPSYKRKLMGLLLKSALNQAKGSAK
ncbi:MAG: FAD binding domain-containing protein [Deltaproteobacteria bacterium]|nr:FAD binding domain-containing protein [Deltaproteobacteria bacterium]